MPLDCVLRRSQTYAGPAMTSPPRPVSSVFSPRLWGAHLAMLVVVAATVALGLWQYGVSHQHKADQVAQLAHATPRPLTKVMGANDPFPGDQIGRPVLVTGSWEPDGTVYVSGHAHDGREGYWAATPLELEGGDAAVYVVRGWTASVQRAPAPPTGTARLVGWLEPGDSAQDTTEDATGDSDAGDAVVASLDIASLIDHVDVDLFSAYVVGADHQADWPASASPVNDGSAGLADVSAPALPKADATTGLRNFLYAIEWWLFAVFAVYVWWRYVRDVTRPAPAGDDGEPAEEDTQDRAVTSDL